METKAQIRTKHLKQRKLLSKEEVQQFSSAVSKQLNDILTEFPDLKKRGIYGYYPLGKEVDLRMVYEKLLRQGCPLAFPRVHGLEMDFYEIDAFTDFEKGNFGVMEPGAACRKVIWQNALCLVPGSVFDEKGNRYGYGKGYYDRYFAKHIGIERMGIAYEMQIETELMAEEWDIRMHSILTNEKWLQFTQQLITG